MPVDRWSDGSWVYHTGDGNGREDASRKDVGERVRVVWRGELGGVSCQTGARALFVGERGEVGAGRLPRVTTVEREGGACRESSSRAQKPAPPTREAAAGS